MKTSSIPTGQAYILNDLHTNKKTNENMYMQCSCLLSPNLAYITTEPIDFGSVSNEAVGDHLTIKLISFNNILKKNYNVKE